MHLVDCAIFMKDNFSNFLLFLLYIKKKLFEKRPALNGMNKRNISSMNVLETSETSVDSSFA